ncbi:MAG: hypothetical protein QWI73_00265 [Alphaproteobacteria bacterium]|nr:hypothetical protein [Alphaproteobacteria bacterium]
MTELKVEQQTSSKSSPKWLLTAIAAVFGLAIASFAAYKWPLFSGAATTASRGVDRLTAVEGRALAIDAKIDQLQQNLTQLQAVNANLLKQQAEQAGAIAALKTTANGTVLSDADRQNVEQLKATSQELQNKLLQLHKLALLSAFNNLKFTIASGHDFTNEISLVKNLGGNDPAINVNNLHIFEQYAPTGIANQQMLLDEFRTQSDSIIGLGSAADSQAASSQKVLNWLKQQITVRHASGNLQGSQPADILARVEYYLKQANYTKANAELSTLPDSMKQNLQAFTAKLQVKIGAETALQSILKQLSETTHMAVPANSTPPVTM